MTLSLTRRQTQCGFEMDLLYFLLGCLMMQLMKIKFELFVFGAVFSYILIIFRSFFSSIDARENNQYSELQDGNSVVLNMDSLQLARTNISSSSNSVDSPKLKALEKLETCVKALEHGNSKFIQMLLEHVKNYEHSQLVPADPNFMMAALKQETIKDLEETTNVMVRAAFENDFSDVYNNCSRKCLNECLMQRIFGLQKLNIEDVHNMSLKDLEHEIEKWIKANSNVALKMLFPCERRICDCIFKFSTSADFCLMDICRGSTIQLLKFSDYLATRSRSPEHLFKTLHMLKIMCDLILEFESLFCDQYNVSIKNEAIVVMAKKLGETIRGIFMELEYACNTADPTTSVLSITIQ